MLSIGEKIQIFTTILEKEAISYADSFNFDINTAGENNNYVFLEGLSSEEEVAYWIDRLKSRIVMKEDQVTVSDIIDDYISCG